MSCHIISRHPDFRPTSPSTTFAALTALALIVVAPARGNTQQPVPPPPMPAAPTPTPLPSAPVTITPTATVPAAIAPYRAPAIALVQPPAGTPLPADRAVIILRFAAGEPSDPLDASSFAVSVNGASRTASFQVAGAEAWGPISDPRSTTPLAPGAYQVTARICSSKGACGSTSATVTVMASDATPARTEESASRKQKLIDLLLAGVRRLVGP